jgi:hypothetical protein
VQFFDKNGEEQAGLIFPDGIGEDNDAIHAFISHSGSLELDLTQGYIKLDTDIFPDDTYYVRDGAVFQTIADRIGVLLSDFLSTSSGDYSNDEYYAQASDGTYYTFYSGLLSNSDQTLAIELTIDGVAKIINVRYILVIN